MSNIFSFADTWNNGATVFSSITLDVTDTASNAASKLIDLKVGGVTKFNVAKDGKITTAGDISASAGFIGAAGLTAGPSPYFTVANGAGGVSGVQLSDAYGFGWCNGASSFAAPDTQLKRHAAGVVTATNGAGGVGYLRTPPTTVGALLSAATAGVGARSIVTDALAPTFMATVVAGGAVTAPVYSDGTNWKVG